ncbi:uncharacterized protein LOC115028920 isoform X2 [Cottoperca gobio]|nr:uncharacterized protein LOC115028920 isoform X2 [Cottoperca gobio]
MDQEGQIVPWKNFFVYLTGKTNDAHLDFVGKLEDVGQNEVISPEDSDYLLVFCPITSRVGTDIDEALRHIPVGKRAILVVMHHTFNPEHVVAASSRQVQNQMVLLTVDCLFYNGNLLKCNRNDIAWHEIQKVLGVPPPLRSTWSNYFIRCIRCILSIHWCKKNWKWLTAGGIFLGFAIIPLIWNSRISREIEVTNKTEPKGI